MAEEAFVAQNSRWRLVLLALGSAGFVVVGAWMVGLFGDAPSFRRMSTEMGVIVGWLCIVFFGFCGFVALRLFMHAGEAFRIDADGITQGQMVKAAFRWDEITDIRPMKISGQPMVCYEVVQERLDAIGGLRARLAAANRSMTSCSFALTISGTDAKMPEVIAAIERFAPSRLLVGD